MTSTLYRAHTTELPGSIHQPLHYSLHTTAINSLQVQSPAVQHSKQQVLKFLHNENLDELAVSHKPWNNQTTTGIVRSGKNQPSWCRPEEVLENRYYHRLQTDALIAEARHRYECAKRGIDPHPDPLIIQPERWNASSQIVEPPLLTLSNVNDTSVQHAVRMCSTAATGDILYCRADRPTLVQRQADLILQDTERRMLEEEQQAAHRQKQQQRRTTDVNYKWQKLLRNHRRHTMSVSDASALATQQLQDEYGADTLKQYLQKIAMEDEAKQNHWDDGLNEYQAVEQLPDAFAVQYAEQQTHRRPPTSPRSFMRSALSTTTNTHVNTRPHSHAPHPKFISHRTTTLSASTKMHPLPPTFEWNAAVLTRTVNPLQSASPKSSTHTYHKPQHPGSYDFDPAHEQHRWTCCDAHAADAIGCISVADDRKVRTVELGSRRKSSHSWTMLQAKLSRQQHAHSASVVQQQRGVVKRFQHTGTYTHTADQQSEGAWSCCLAANENAAGCRAVVVANEQRWALD